MSTTLKLLIGLAAVWLAAWIDHGPLGHGERTIAALQAAADGVVRDAGVPGVQVRFGSDPLSRVATLSGPAEGRLLPAAGRREPACRHDSLSRRPGAGVADLGPSAAGGLCLTERRAEPEECLLRTTESESE